MGFLLCGTHCIEGNRGSKRLIRYRQNALMPFHDNIQFVTWHVFCVKRQDREKKSCLPYNAKKYNHI